MQTDEKKRDITYWDGNFYERQRLSPNAYAKLILEDQWIEDEMQRHEAAWIISQLTDAHTVLDLGFGSGIIVRALTAVGKQVTLIDGAEKFCYEAAQISGVQVVHSMFEDFQPLIAKYDCVIASFVLEHLENPLKLLMRAREWAPKLIVVVGNANSYHRQLAVRMGLQMRLDSLSERDKIVGHYRVYDLTTIDQELRRAGWEPRLFQGLMLKSLPNSMMAGFDPKLIRAMCETPVPPDVAANICISCRAF